MTDPIRSASSPSTDNQKLDQPLDPLAPGGDVRPDMTNPVDFAFLMTQTLGDQALEHELLDLFVTHTRALLRELPALPASAQADVAHRLKGSARGIGAWAVAEAADRFEAAPPLARLDTFNLLECAVAEAETAIRARLTT